MTPSELITKGKSAVEAELARIEGDLAAAKMSAMAQSTTLAAELKKYLATHAAEVATAESLIARAGLSAGGVVASTVLNTVPAATLTEVSSIATRVKKFFTPFTWKHGMLVGMALLVAHYLLGKII